MPQTTFRGQVLSLVVAMLALDGSAVVHAEVGVGKRAIPKDRVGSYRTVGAQGIRLDMGRALMLDTIAIPVMARMGDTALIRVFGAERGAPAPSIEEDRTPPMAVRAYRNGYQNIVVRFNPPLQLSGNQAFIVIDKATAGFRPVTVRDSMTAVCRCQGEEYTQQVTRDSAGWKTAPLRFPWKIGARIDSSVASLAFDADTIGNMSVNTAFYLAVCDVDGDDRTDIVSPGGVFLGNGKRSYKQLLTQEAMLGVGAVCSYADARGRVVYLVGTGASGTVTGADPVGIKRVRTPLDTVQFAALMGMDSPTPRMLVVGTNVGEQGQQVLLVDPADQRVIRTIPAHDVGFEDIRSLTSTTEAARSGNVVVVGHDGRNLATATIHIVNDAVQVTQRTIRQLSRETFDVPGPGIGAMAASGQLVMMHTQAVADRGDDSDRRSSVTITDLDGDGMREILQATSDTCRSVTMAPMDTNDRQVPYADFSMIWGSQDIAISDLDGNGMQDLVGYVAGRTMILWNETMPRLPGVLQVPRMYRGEEIVAVQQGSKLMEIPTPAGMHGINVMTDDPYVPVYGIGDGHPDSVRTARGNVYDARDVFKQVAIQAAQSMPIRIAIQPNPLSTLSQMRLSGMDGVSPVTIEVTDMSGRHMRTWQNMTTGMEHSLAWDGSDNLGSPLASGTYQITVRCGENVGTTSVLIVH